MDVEQIFAEFLKRGVFLLGVISLFAGIGCLFAPKLIARINEKLSKTISTEEINRQLEKEHHIDTVFMRYRIIFGAIFLVIAFIVLSHCYIIFSA